MRVASGARALESLLLDDLERRARDPARLAKPVRVVVPSKSLREHVQGALVRRAGRAVVGIHVQTLHGLALEVLERTGVARPAGDRLLPVLVRRAARAEPALHLALDGLHDGYGVVTGTVRDLLDAGFTPERADALSEGAASPTSGRGASDRARAIVAVAGATLRELEALGLSSRSQLLVEARAQLEIDADRALPASSLLVHGFADATGVATDLIDALVGRHGAVVYLDLPPDPAVPGALDAGLPFARRFVERLTGRAPESLALEARTAAAEVHLFRAHGAQAEVREVAQRVSVLLAEGATPESIGVVARRLEPYATPIRIELGRLGIPCSGVGAHGPRTATGRRLRDLLRILHTRAQTPADYWLGALGRRRLRSSLADARTALHAVGAGRLADVADLDTEGLLDGKTSLALPVRTGLELGEDGSRAPRRQLADRRLEEIAGAARDLCAELERWPKSSSAGRHARALGRIAERALGWEHEAVHELRSMLAGLVEECGEHTTLEQNEWALLVERAVEARANGPIGGEGGGVQVLDATEARARTFAHLFVLGMNRDEFPRIVHEDPLLPDPLRRSMCTTLAQLPIKEIGHAEERYLFAQLLSSSPRVTLSWQNADDDGRARAVSPLVVRLRLGGIAPDVAAAPSPWAPPGASPLPAAEHAIAAGLHAKRGSWRARLPAALREAEDDAAPEARARVLDEQDPDLSSAQGRRRSTALGPYLGLAGAPSEAADPRHTPLAVTGAEGVARCGWQAFLRRGLRLEAPPDVLESLPDVDARVLGTAVHAVLQEIVTRAIADPPLDVAHATTAEARPVPWPDADEIEQIVADAAMRTLRAEGIASRGLARVLALRARAFLEAAREFAGLGAGSSIVGAEVEGTATTREGPVRFTVDRLDRDGERLVLIDYKTGRPLSLGKRPSTRRRELLTRVAHGQALQVAAYALAAPQAEGLYLYLRPDLEPDVRVARIACDDATARGAFESAFACVRAAWESGSLPPQLVEGADSKTPRACEWCDLLPACVQGDSGARVRLESWAARGIGESEAERAALDLWALRDRPPPEDAP